MLSVIVIRDSRCVVCSLIWEGGKVHHIDTLLFTHSESDIVSNHERRQSTSL